MATSSAVGKLSREEFRRQKDLDAARKAGTAPAELDSEGRAINPHIPQYIAKAPWYLDTGSPSLAHQRRPEDEHKVPSINDWTERGQTTGPAATKYRKGACENCGAMSHSKRDCLERPRRRGAKFSGKDIRPDEVVHKFEGGYDAKRDRWKGYDPAEHKRIYEEYEAVEAARQQMREEAVDNRTTTDLAAVKKLAKATGATNDADFGSSDEEEADEDKYADAADAVGQKMDAKTRITVRNLRIREDTAKYLINLDPESAYYDPKTRSMREAPRNDIRPEDATFAGENFLRISGEAQEAANLQLFAWQANARGNDVHVNALPTQGEKIHKAFNTRKEEYRETQKSTILDKYGGEQYLQKVPKELLTGQTENYIEYSRTGQVINGKERVKARSKYPEDVFMNNHTAIWGSWYDPTSALWGFACCRSTTHASYCAGEAGIRATEESGARSLLSQASTSRVSASLDADTDVSGSTSKANPSSRKRLGDVDPELNQTRLQEAIAEERKRKILTGDDLLQQKKRKYDGGFQGTQEVTEEEIEAYRMTRTAGAEDPMANYVDNAEEF